MNQNVLKPIHLFEKYVCLTYQLQSTLKIQVFTFQTRRIILVLHAYYQLQRELCFA